MHDNFWTFLRSNTRSACRLLVFIAITSICTVEAEAAPTVPIPAVEQQQRGWEILRRSAVTYGRVHTFDCNIGIRTTTTVQGKKPDNRQGALRIAWQFPNQGRVEWKQMASRISMTMIYTANDKVSSTLMKSDITPPMSLNSSQTMSHPISKNEDSFYMMMSMSRLGAAAPIIWGRGWRETPINGGTPVINTPIGRGYKETPTLVYATDGGKINGVALDCVVVKRLNDVVGLVPQAGTPRAMPPALQATVQETDYLYIGKQDHLVHRLVKDTQGKIAPPPFQSPSRPNPGVPRGKGRTPPAPPPIQQIREVFDFGPAKIDKALPADLFRIASASNAPLTLNLPMPNPSRPPLRRP